MKVRENIYRDWYIDLFCCEGVNLINPLYRDVFSLANTVAACLVDVLLSEVQDGG